TCLALALGCHQGGPQLPFQSTSALLGPAAAVDPAVEKPVLQPVGMSTVMNPELPKRPISLSECVALALENGRTGAYFDGPGSNSRSSVTGLADNRTVSSASDSIRVFAYDQGIAATGIEEGLSRFDVWAESSMFWNRIDQRSRFLTPL